MLYQLCEAADSIQMASSETETYLGLFAVFRGEKRVFRFVVHFKIHNQPESLKADVLGSPFPPMLPIEMTKSSLSTALNESNNSRK